MKLGIKTTCRILDESVTPFVTRFTSALIELHPELIDDILCDLPRRVSFTTQIMKDWMHRLSKATNKALEHDLEELRSAFCNEPTPACLESLRMQLESGKIDQELHDAYRKETEAMFRCLSEHVMDRIVKEFADMVCMEEKS